MISGLSAHRNMRVDIFVMGSWLFVFKCLLLTVQCSHSSFRFQHLSDLQENVDHIECLLDATISLCVIYRRERVSGSPI